MIRTEALYRPVLTSRRMQILEAYTPKAKNIRRMMKLALFWSCHPGDYCARQYLECRQKMIKMAKTTDDWTLCAGMWISPQDNAVDSTGLECMRRAEEVAHNIEEWLDCAGTWKCTLQDLGSNTLRCLRNAYQLAKSTGEFTKIAFFFEWCLFDFKVARFLLRKAASKIASDDDAKAYAEGVKEYESNFRIYGKEPRELGLPLLVLTGNDFSAVHMASDTRKGK